MWCSGRYPVRGRFGCGGGVLVGKALKSGNLGFVRSTTFCSAASRSLVSNPAMSPCRSGPQCPSAQSLPVINARRLRAGQCFSHSISPICTLFVGAHYSARGRRSRSCRRAAHVQHLPAEHAEARLRQRGVSHLDRSAIGTLCGGLAWPLGLIAGRPFDRPLGKLNVCGMVSLQTLAPCRASECRAAAARCAQTGRPVGAA